jgi:hypothetical protein
VRAGLNEATYPSSINAILPRRHSAIPDRPDCILPAESLNPL